MIGKTLAHYEITSQLGKGGMGEVYQATDVFAIQDEISQAIAEKLRIQFSADRLPIEKKAGNIEAYNLNLKGRYYLYKLTPDGLA